MSTLKFVFIAAILMLLADTYLFGGTRSYIEDAKQEPHKIEQVQEELPPPVRVQPDNGEEYFEADPAIEVPEPAETQMPDLSEAIVEPEPVIKEDAPLPPVVMPPKRDGKMKVAIIIDDLGMDLKHSRQIMDLPAPITLAFLPYGTKTRDYAVIGKGKGHELIIHTPMEAMDTKQNIGPGGLKSGMHEAAFEQNFNAMLKSFDGYVGINNHMGSKLTQDKAAMKELMGLLKTRGLFFVDSKTIGSSVAASSARSAGVPYAERDVFLDHVDSREFVDKALRQTEATAMRKGYAIAIGHPKANTIAGLRDWLPTLAGKGIELVPVSELLIKPSGSVEVSPSEEAAPVIETAPVVEETAAPVEQEASDPVTVPDAPLLLHLPPPTELPAIY